MFIKQVSIFVDNKKGSIAEVISILGKESINIKALSVADAADFGIVRLIVDGPDKAFEVLKKNNYKAKIASALAIGVEDKPNALGEVLDIIRNNDIEITYIYSLIGYMNNYSTIIIKTPVLEKTEELLKINNIQIINPSELYKE